MTSVTLDAKFGTRVTRPSRMEKPRAAGSIRRKLCLGSAFVVGFHHADNRWLRSDSHDPLISIPFAARWQADVVTSRRTSQNAVEG